LDPSNVTWVGLEPSAFMTKMSQSPHWLSNAIRCPSGDHSGRRSSHPEFVRFIWPVPSLFITKMLEWA
jgi:hypothetical protein